MTPAAGGDPDGLDRQGFVDRFRGLAPADRRAFVAALWAATGWEPAVDGPVVTVTRTGPAAETERLLVPADVIDADVDADIDAVVTARSGQAADVPAGVSVLTPSDLYRRARYGLDRAAADRLFEEHFGRPLTTDTAEAVPSGSSDGPPAPTVSPTPDPPTDRGYGPGALLGAGVTGAAIALLLVATVAWAGGVPMGTPAAITTAPSTEGTGGTVRTDVPAGEGSPTPTVRDSSTLTIADRYGALRPTCDRPPGVVIAIQLGALRTNNASTNRGIMTVFRFASRSNRQATGPFSNFVDIVTGERYAPLLGYERVLLGPIEERERGPDGRLTAVSRTVVVFGPAGNASAYEFTLTREASGAYGDCWKTDAVVTVPLNETPVEDAVTG